MYKNILITVAACIMLVLVMVTTSPDNFSAPLLGAFFVLLYVTLVSLLVLVLQVLHVLRIVRVPLPKMLRIAAIAGVLPIFIILLHSIGQLTVRDVLLAVIFFALLYFYFGRMNNKVQS
jgi:hypothetical protein